MTTSNPFKYEEHLVAILKDADNKLVGRTRMQKINYILEVSGLGVGFSFEYKHYGPYSEELTEAISFAKLFGYLDEEEEKTNWGGWYSIFTLPDDNKSDDKEVLVRRSLIEEMKDVSSVDLELAATALFLFREGEDSPWTKTAKLKPEKSKSLETAKKLYKKLLLVEGLPSSLPELPSS